MYAKRRSVLHFVDCHLDYKRKTVPSLIRRSLWDLQFIEQIGGRNCPQRLTLLRQTKMPVTLEAILRPVVPITKSPSDCHS
jgi:hypothetical protein